MKNLNEFLQENLISEANGDKFYGFAAPMMFDEITGIDIDDLWSHIYIDSAEKGVQLSGRNMNDIIKQAEKLIKKNYDFPNLVAYSVYSGEEPINQDNYDEFDFEETVIGKDLHKDAEAYLY